MGDECFTVQTVTVQWTFNTKGKPLTVKRGDRLKFVWNSKKQRINHDLWQLPGPVAYQQCSFKKNKKLKELATETDVGSYTTKPLKAGVYFYGCGVPGHCKSGGQKLKVTVK